MEENLIYFEAVVNRDARSGEQVRTGSKIGIAVEADSL